MSDVRVGDVSDGNGLGGLGVHAGSAVNDVGSNGRHVVTLALYISSQHLVLNTETAKNARRTYSKTPSWALLGALYVHPSLS